MLTPELRAKVVRLLRAHLDEFPADREVSSGELLAHLASVVPPDEFQAIGKSRLLMDLAKRDLAAYAHRGQPVTNRFGGTKTPWIWHAPGCSAEVPRRPGHERFATIANAYQVPMTYLEVLDTEEHGRNRIDDLVNHFNARLDALEAKIDTLLTRTEMFK